MLDDLTGTPLGGLVLEQGEQVHVDALEQLGGPGAEDERVVLDQERQRQHVGSGQLGREVRTQADVRSQWRVRKRHRSRSRG